MGDIDADNNAKYFLEEGMMPVICDRCRNAVKRNLIYLNAFPITKNMRRTVLGIRTYEKYDEHGNVLDELLFHLALHLRKRLTGTIIRYALVI